MDRMKRKYVLLLGSLAFSILCSNTYAGTPLYQDSLTEGRSNMTGNTSEVDLLLSRDAEPETEDSGFWVIFSLSGSGCLLSGCAFSGCLGSACAGTGCFLSGCGTSGCVMSGCAGSVCGGSLCGGSACVGSACVGVSVCYGSICGGSACVGSVCGGSGCGGSICGLSGCGGSYCAISVCGGTSCQASVCLGSGCGLSLCLDTGCSASACDSGCCEVSSSMSVTAPSETLVAAQTSVDGALVLAAKYPGLYRIQYRDSSNQVQVMDVRLNDSHITRLSLDAKELLTVSHSV